MNPDDIQLTRCENTPYVLIDPDAECLALYCRACTFYERLRGHPTAMDVMRADARHNSRMRVLN